MRGPWYPSAPRPGRIGWGAALGGLSPQQNTQPGTPIRREEGGIPRVRGAGWGTCGGLCPHNTEWVGKVGRDSCGGIPWVPTDPTVCPLLPEGGKWGENHGNRALPQAAVGGDRFARAPHPVLCTPCPGTCVSSTMATMCAPPVLGEAWWPLHPWGGLVTPLPLRAVAMAVREGGRSGGGRRTSGADAQWVKEAMCWWQRGHCRDGG